MKPRRRSGQEWASVAAEQSERERLLPADRGGAGAEEKVGWAQPEHAPSAAGESRAGDTDRRTGHHVAEPVAVVVQPGKRGAGGDGVQRYGGCMVVNVVGQRGSQGKRDHAVTGWERTA